ncbi:MAG: hypothetical protein IPP70_07105 [Elusimicrobia bacterium]|nr:hypothetical protein [Elusimicrobiota bacterium]
MPPPPPPLAGVTQHNLRWILLITPTAAAIGTACAFFLWALDRTTGWRWRYPALLGPCP